jgi:membrane-associated phospholipid phosphatase
MRATDFARRLATTVSWVDHPLVFVSLTVTTVLLNELPARAAFPLIMALFLALIAPMAVLLALGVRSGRWRDADVSVREERKRFFPVAIPLSALGGLVMWLAGAPRYITRGAIVTLVLLMMAAVVNLRFKISLHVMFATYCATVLLRMSNLAGLVACVLALLVFWSRLYLTRHTVAETIAGAVAGGAGGWVAAWWPF